MNVLATVYRLGEYFCISQFTPFSRSYNCVNQTEPSEGSENLRETFCEWRC